MKTLVQGKRQFERSEIVDLASKVQAKKIGAKEAAEVKQKSDQAKWKEGMDKDRQLVRKERRDEEMRKKRIMTEKQNQSVLKRGKL